MRVSLNDRANQRGLVAHPPKTTPFIHVRFTDSGPLVHGPASCVIGYPADGIYTEWHWNGSELTLQNDRYGLFPTYYFVGEDQFGLSPSLEQLFALGASTDLDDTALAVFVRLGYFLGSDTAFRQIRALPASARLEWQRGHLKVLGQRLKVKPATIGRNSAIDAYIDLFRASIARRPPQSSEFGTPLSGGRDSRHILFELCRAGHPPRFCVTGLKPGGREEDVKVAKLVAARVGIPHMEIPESRRPLRQELRKNRLTGFCADEHGWYLGVADYLTRHSSTVYDGLAGDVLSAGTFTTRERLDYYEHADHLGLANHLLRAQHERFLAAALTPDRYRCWSRERALERLCAEASCHQEAANPVAAFFLWNRTRREIALSPYSLMPQVQRLYLPYLDEELFDFLASLPASMVVDHEFHTDTITRAFPEYADVRFENQSLPERYGSYFFRYARDLAAYAYLRYPPPRSIRSAHLLPRMIGSMLDRRRHLDGHLLMTHLIQLERFCDEQRRLQSSGSAE